MENLVDIKDDVKIGLAGTRDLQGDLFLPPGEEKNRPAILIVHGGGWREGDRKQLRGYGILLRQDNADLRLTKTGHKIGLASKKRLKRVVSKEKQIDELFLLIKKEKLKPTEINDFLKKKRSSEIKEASSVYKLILRPHIKLHDLLLFYNKKSLLKFGVDIVEQVDIQTKYQSYIDKEKEMVEKMKTLENKKIDPKINYNNVFSLSSEGKDKLIKIKPSTIGDCFITNQISIRNTTDTSRIYASNIN